MITSGSSVEFSSQESSSQRVELRDQIRCNEISFDQYNALLSEKSQLTKSFVSFTQELSTAACISHLHLTLNVLFSFLFIDSQRVERFFLSSLADIRVLSNVSSSSDVSLQAFDSFVYFFFCLSYRSLHVFTSIFFQKKKKDSFPSLVLFSAHELSSLKCLH